MSGESEGQNGASEAGTQYSVQDAIDAVGFGRYQKVLCAIVGLVYITDAMEMMLLSFLGPAIRCEDWGVTPAQESMLTTVVFLGMMFGALLWGLAADRKGRKFTVFATSCWIGVFGMASALSPSFNVLLLTRCAVGFGLGGVPVAFSFFAEFLPSSTRGKFGVWAQFLWTIGTFIEAILGWALLQNAGWRWLLFASALPVFLLLPFFAILPESPRFLSVRGDDKGVNQLLAKVASVNERELPAGTLRESISPQMPVKEVIQHLMSDTYRRDTLLLYVLWFANAFVYYGLVLMTTELTVVHDGGATKCAGVGRTAFSAGEFTSIVLVSTAEVPGVLLSGLIVDRIGRRGSQGLEFLVTGACTLLLFIPVMFVRTAFLFVARAAIMGAFSVTYLYTPELYPTRFRATAFGIANSFARVGGMVCPFVGQALVEEGHLAESFLIFAFLCFVATAAAFNLSVETSGRALVETVGDSKQVQEMARMHKHSDKFARLDKEEKEGEEQTHAPSAQA